MQSDVPLEQRVRLESQVQVPVLLEDVQPLLESETAHDIRAQAHRRPPPRIGRRGRTELSFDAEPAAFESRGIIRNRNFFRFRRCYPSVRIPCDEA